MYEAIKPSAQFLASLTPTDRHWFEHGGVNSGAESFAEHERVIIAGRVADGGFDVLPNDLDKPVNPKQAYGDLKAAVHLVPPALQIGASKAFKEGAVKYGAYNWRNTKVESMTYIGGLLRHALAYLDGEDVDPESTTGKLHLEGIAACVGILLDGTYGGFLVDNRPPKGPAPTMVRTPAVK